MELDRRQLDRILSMDDESFALLARTIAEAAGANKMKTEMLLSNPELLKRRISGLTAEEARALIDSAGKEKSEAILRLLRERGVDIGR
ncbi:MAG: hypothetical protein J6R45_06830 [Clostridia bacterium]|nr:hypothetical protein [Clostridia bacterium]MBO5787023.1 hypothetical protein [Clostridia bacterium]MBO5914018.1 hypothetical protein [Clostridia bacterium]